MKRGEGWVCGIIHCSEKKLFFLFALGWLSVCVRWGTCGHFNKQLENRRNDMSRILKLIHQLIVLSIPFAFIRISFQMVEKIVDFLFKILFYLNIILTLTSLQFWLNDE